MNPRFAPRSAGDSGAGRGVARPAPKLRRPTRTSWAELMKRVLEIAVLVCPHCGGPRELIALPTDGLVVRRIVGHLGLSTEPPALAPARAPPEPELAW